MTKVSWSAVVRVAGAAALILSSVSCGDLTREGTSSSYLIITALEASSGAEDGEFGGTLTSDVITVVDDEAGVYADIGRVQFALGLKDPGAPASPASPTQNNFITVERYRVRYTRSDGRNTEGVDVPYAFDGAFTATVSGSTTAGFIIVRHQAKQEAPLRALVSNGIIVSTIAEVTFYGHDQTGREVSVMGKILITFGNFADPT